MNRFCPRLADIPVFAILLLFVLTPAVYGQVSYTVTGTLSLQSGTDPFKLNGAQVTATTSISQTAAPSSTSVTSHSSSNTYTGPPVSLTVGTLGTLSCSAAVTVSLTDNVGAPDTIDINNCTVASLATLTAAVTIPTGAMISNVPASIPSTGITGQVTAQLTGKPATVFSLTSATIVASGTPPPAVNPSPISWTPTAVQGSTTSLQQPVNFTTSVASSEVSFTTSVTGGSWLTVSPAAADTASIVTITANPAKLTAGVYTGTVLLSYGNSGVAATQIPVTFTITGGAVTLTATPTALAFNYAPGGAAPSSQTLSITAPSATQVSAAVSSGNSWLSVTPGNGTTPATFAVSVNTAGLTSGTLSGSIQITSSGASPLSIPVTLNVTSTILTVPSTTLTFNATVGGSTPAAQSVSISGTSGISFTTSTTSSGGAAWLSATPSGTVPSSISVSINASALSGLTAGQYSGTVTVTSAGAGGSPGTIPVTLVVAAPTLTATPATLSFSYSIGSGTQPAPQTINIVDAAKINFTASAATTLGGSWLSVTPAAGAASGALTVSVNTKGLNANVYNGTITIAASGTTPGATPGATPLVINVTLQSIEPAVSGIVSAASYESSGFAPGTIVTVFGNLLGPQTGAVFSVNSNGTIDTTLGGTSVKVEGIPAALLFAQNGQVNMILPYSLNTTGEAYVEVTYNNATSVQFNIPLAPAAVQIFTADASGSGPGSILNQDFSINSASNPAAPGSVVMVYGTGGGAVNPVVNAGSVAGATLSWITSQYSATVNGEAATVLYAGSAPGLVYGVYQFNVQLPADVQSGSAKIVLKVGNSTSQSDVTVFVK
jgi:uncharacterized protein (TIGR03437 family)